MTSAIRTVYGRFEIRPWWSHRDADGDEYIVSAMIGDDCPEAGGDCDAGHLPEGIGVYEETAEGPQMHVCDAPDVPTAQRIADALDIQSRMDSNGDVA